MRRFFSAVAIMALASSAFAGLTYEVQSTTTGLRNVNIAGKVTVDGPRLRMDVTTGDNMLFKDNTVVLSSDGGKTMSVFDPSTKNYYDLQLDQVIGSTSSMLRSLGEMVKLSFNNPQVSVRDGGDAGTVEGLPTHKYVLDASYDMVVNAMGQKMTTHLTLSTESWITDQLASEFSTFLQMRGMRTGVEALDQLIEAQSSIMHGFPLKQISTVRVTQQGGEMTMTTTSTVRNIERKSVEAAQFVTPAGYTKIDDPITKMMKQLKQ